MWLLTIASVKAGERPKIVGYYMSNTYTHVTAIYSTITAAGEAGCISSIDRGLAYVQGNSIYCNAQMDPNDPNLTVRYLSTASKVETCPGYSQIYGYGWGIRCLDNDEKPPICDCTGNPVLFASKEKVQTEVDYESETLRFTRFYSSRKVSDVPPLFKSGWSHSYRRFFNEIGPARIGLPPSVYIFDPSAGENGAFVGGTGFIVGEPGVYAVRIYRADGYGYNFGSTDGGQTFKADADVNAQLVVLERDIAGNGVRWRLTTPENDRETYHLGMLEQIQYENGRSVTLTYSDSSTPSTIAPVPGLLIAVTDDAGRSLQFEYGTGSQILRMLDPAGQAFEYEYTGDLMTQVQYPDGYHRQYHFNELENAPLSNKPKLTGISVEAVSGQLTRYATYKYDNKGAPISTEHAGGVYRYTFDYATNRITDPLGATRSYGFSTVAGRRAQSSITQPTGYGATVTRTDGFDARGNLESVRDWASIRTYRTFDSQSNLEIKRVEGLDTPVARTINTAWDSTLRKPLQIAEPRRLTTYTYDAKGNVLTRVVRATNDTTGAQGFSAAPVGQSAVWVYTYNARSQVLTAKGPRSDVNDTTTYDYDGNLASITNAAGHVTTYSDYDAHGKVGRIVDPNGSVSTFSYTPRGAVASISVNGETTGYSYDGAGQLVLVTLPNGAVLNYSYDAAQRLTAISDGGGNSVSYSLDPMGNRLSEQVRDSSGSLTRQISRVMDVLGRVQTVTGAL
jgi:YD repeat-containing protein